MDGKHSIYEKRLQIVSSVFDESMLKQNNIEKTSHLLD